MSIDYTTNLPVYEIILSGSQCFNTFKPYASFQLLPFFNNSLLLNLSSPKQINRQIDTQNTGNLGNTFTFAGRWSTALEWRKTVTVSPGFS